MTSRRGTDRSGRGRQLARPQVITADEQRRRSRWRRFWAGKDDEPMAQPGDPRQLKVWQWPH